MVMEVVGVVVDMCWHVDMVDLEEKDVNLQSRVISLLFTQC